jgi:flagellar protein FliO/FliZ
MRNATTQLRTTAHVVPPAFALAAIALSAGAMPAAAASLIARSPAERAPLHLSGTPSGAHPSSSTGASLIRTIVGLAIVLAVIWGLTWVLKQFKSHGSGRAAGSGLRSLANLPLGSGRSLALVRAGSDFLLLAIAERSVVPVHRYSEAEAQAAGLLALDDSNPLLAEAVAGSDLQLPPTASQSLLDRVRGWTVRA